MWHTNPATGCDTELVPLREGTAISLGTRVDLTTGKEYRATGTAKEGDVWCPRCGFRGHEFTREERERQGAA